MWQSFKYFMHGMSHNADSTFSSTKVWQSAGFLTVTYIMVMLTLQGKMEGEYMLIYLTATAGARTFQNYLATKTGNKDAQS